MRTIGELRARSSKIWFRASRIPLAEHGLQGAKGRGRERDQEAVVKTGGGSRAPAVVGVRFGTVSFSFLYFPHGPGEHTQKGSHGWSCPMAKALLVGGGPARAVLSWMGATSHMWLFTLTREPRVKHNENFGS